MSETSLLDRIRDAAPMLDDSDWADVVARAGLAPEPEPAPRRRRPRRLLVLAFAAAVIAAVAALAPWGGEDDRLTILDRALAAVSGGPVLHAALRTNAASVVFAPGRATRYTVVDLASGQERDVETQTELWYDPERRLVHYRTSTDGFVNWDVLSSPTETRTNMSKRAAPADGLPSIDPALEAFLKGYRQALEDGTATVSAREETGGRRVIWLRFGSPGKPAREVAVDEESYEALYLRRVCRSKCSPPQPTYRIVTLEGVSVDAADFTPPVVMPQPPPKGAIARARERTINLAEATTMLGHTALWSGASVNGLALARVRYLPSSWHRRFPPTRQNRIAAGRGLRFVYGRDRTATVSITQTPSYRFGPVNLDSRQAGRPLAISGAPIPPEGQAALTSIGPRYGWVAQLRTDGLFVEISSKDRELVLAAARALQPVPTG